MSKDNKSFFPNAEGVNLSTSFPTRVRCKECGKIPNLYYYLSKPKLFLDHKYLRAAIYQNSRAFRNFRKYAANFYFHPSDIKSMKSLNYFNQTSFSCKLHMNKGVSDKLYIEYIACECGFYAWAFCNIDNFTRPELLNRKSKNVHPNL